MSKLSDLRKQIAALEAEVARVASEEMAASVNKVKAMMASLGVTIEHLTGTSSSAAAKKSAAKGASAKKTATKSATAKRAGAGVAKYMDPKTGKTWTGFGRAPAWIANAKNRDAYLIGAPAEPAVQAKPAAKTVRRAAGKVVASGRRKSTRATKEAVPAKAAGSKKASAKKTSAKKTAAKRPSAKKTVANAAAARKRTAKAKATASGAPDAAPSEAADQSGE